MYEPFRRDKVWWVGAEMLRRTSGEGGEIIAWNYKSQTELWRKKVHSGEVSALAVCGDLVISEMVNAPVNVVSLYFPRCVLE